MTNLSTLANWLGERLPELIAEHRVPGAVIGVYAHGEYLERAAGVLNTRTGVPVTTDSLCQIGSISKVWTATLALQLVEDDPRTGHRGRAAHQRPRGRFPRSLIRSRVLPALRRKKASSAILASS